MACVRAGGEVGERERESLKYRIGVSERLLCRACGALKEAPRYPILGSRRQTATRDMDLDWHGVTLVLSTCVLLLAPGHRAVRSEARSQPAYRSWDDDQYCDI